MGYVVSAPMALVDRTDGSTATCLRGSAVPEDATEKHLEHLLNLGLVVEAEPAPTGLVGRADAGVPEPSAKVPAKVASKDEWVTYAVSQGVPQDEAESSTKDQLVERFKG